MPKRGWSQLLSGSPWFTGQGQYPIAAYSEFMPPPRLILKPYGSRDPWPLDESERWGWPITEYEEALMLRPGLQRIAEQVVNSLVHLGHGRSTHGIAKEKLLDNPYCSRELAEAAGKLAHERYVTLMPLALSRTQDDKGRVVWTLFGGSEQGPARGFWKSFYVATTKEVPPDEALAYVRRLLVQVYHEPAERLGDLHRMGFRVLPAGDKPLLPHWQEDPLPSWTAPFILGERGTLRGVKYVLTFRPFDQLPAAIRRAYLTGKLHLLPCPGSLLFWGCRRYLELQEELPFAVQIPLQHVVNRYVGLFGIRVPQVGWLHEPHPDHPLLGEHNGHLRNTYRRTHRWARVHRDEEDTLHDAREDKLLHVLFSTTPADMGLYGKPMARNVQIWSHDFDLVLDGPNANRTEIQKAMHLVPQGGLFGYRFQYPAMRVGLHEIFWHRPLVAYHSAENDAVVVIPDAPTGYLTAYRADRPDLARPLELWPRLLRREPHVAAVEQFGHLHEARPHQTTINVRKLLDTRCLLGDKPLAQSFARQLLTLPKSESLDDWLDALPGHAPDSERGQALANDLRLALSSGIDTRSRKNSIASLTFGRTAKRSYEVEYWKTIDYLAEGRFLNKNNADCVREPATEKELKHAERDLHALGDYLVDYYQTAVAKAGMKGKALVGDLPFPWQTDFDFPWFGGWVNNQVGMEHERDLIVVIPGRDRRRAVIMADHYDTAYMCDHYEKEYGGHGAHVAAAGADDNHSATAALMLGAPIFLELSKAGRLGCDIWLIHLTGEEFPADCMGARHLSQCLVEGTLRMRRADGKTQDLSKTRIQGVYVLDMVAHNNDHDRDVFQIAPGTTRESMWLALQAHLANDCWNRSTETWNRRPGRRDRGRCQRSLEGSKIPETARHLPLHGEVRPHYDPRSTLYNTDGQVFSDAGIPVVLFMENYDINRSGYHDSFDTMANIDLDYGAALSAIAIESVARAATEKD
jgi:hypothetical protein